jgi:hypothetical protein
VERIARGVVRQGDPDPDQRGHHDREPGPYDAPDEERRRSPSRGRKDDRGDGDQDDQDERDLGREAVDLSQ